MKLLSTHLHISPLFWISFPFRSPQSFEEFSVLYSKFSLAVYCIHNGVYMSIRSPNSSHCALPLVIQKFVLYVCVSMSALQIRSSISICSFNFKMKIYFYCGSLWHLILVLYVMLSNIVFKLLVLCWIYCIFVTTEAISHDSHFLSSVGVVIVDDGGFKRLF